MTRKLLRIYFASVMLTLFLLTSASAAPTGKSSDEVAQEISETTMSPFCPGRTISSCPSPQARELRNQIHGWLEEGNSKQQVMDRLLTAYGEDVRGEPVREGFGLVGWVIPPVFVLVSALFMILKLRQMRRVRADEKLDPVADSSTQARVASALKARL